MYFTVYLWTVEWSGVDCFFWQSWCFFNVLLVDVGVAWLW